jgi:hypothetical protein
MKTNMWNFTGQLKYIELDTLSDPLSSILRKLCNNRGLKKKNLFKYTEKNSINVYSILKNEEFQDTLFLLITPPNTISTSSRPILTNWVIESNKDSRSYSLGLVEGSARDRLFYSGLSESRLLDLIDLFILY